MIGLVDRDYFLLAVILYGLSTVYAVFLWRKNFREDDRVNYVLLAGAFIAHTAAMMLRGFSLSRCPVNNLFEAMMFMMWTIVASYLVVGLWRKLRFVGVFASPVLFAMGVFALMPSLDAVPGKHSSGLASFHAALIMLAYGAFGLSSVAGVMYLMEERGLKAHKVRTVLSRLPPIQRLELIAWRTLQVGFVLLTIGLALSPFLVKEAVGVFFQQDAKLTWSILVWLVYAGLLVMRHRHSHGGRRFAWGTVGTFSFILLTFWGVNELSKLHQP